MQCTWCPFEFPASLGTRLLRLLAPAVVGEPVGRLGEERHGGGDGEGDGAADDADGAPVERRAQRVDEGDARAHRQRPARPEPTPERERGGNRE